MEIKPDFIETVWLSSISPLLVYDRATWRTTQYSHSYCRHCEPVIVQKSHCNSHLKNLSSESHSNCYHCPHSGNDTLPVFKESLLIEPIIIQSIQLQLSPLSKLQQQDMFQRSVRVYFAMARMNTTQWELSSVRTSWVEFESVLGLAYLLNERLVIWPRNPSPTHVSVIVQNIMPHWTYHYSKASNCHHCTNSSKKTGTKGLSGFNLPWLGWTLGNENCLVFQLQGWSLNPSSGGLAYSMND